MTYEELKNNVEQAAKADSHKEVDGVPHAHYASLVGKTIAQIASNLYDPRLALEFTDGTYICFDAEESEWGLISKEHFDACESLEVQTKEAGDLSTFNRLRAKYGW